jgi:co-chaperonin GroES (HSP10)
MKYPKPFGNRVLVRVNKLMAGKIIVSSTKAPNTGEVVEISDSRDAQYCPSVGDKVMFAEFLKKDIEVPEDKENVYVLVEIEGIQAIL